MSKANLPKRLRALRGHGELNLALDEAADEIERVWGESRARGVNIMLLQTAIVSITEHNNLCPHCDRLIEAVLSNTGHSSEEPR